MRSKKILMIAISVTLVIGLLAGCGGGGGSNVDGDAPIMIIIGHTDTSQRSLHRAWYLLEEYLDEHAPGKFKVEVYPDGQLGNSPDLMAGVKLGTITLGFELSPVLAQAAGPESSCIDLPFLYPTYEAWEKGIFENGGMELYKASLNGSGYYCLDMFYSGIRQVISRDAIYRNAADLRGQKVRVQQNDLNIAMWTAMGANPTPMSWGEVITSLSQGQIDALDHSLGVFNDFNLHEIAPYLTITNHVNSPCPIYVSEDWINSLPSDLRAVFEEGVRRAAAWQRDEERGLEMSFVERFKNEGTTVYELNTAEINAFIESVKPVYEMWAEKVGQDLIDAWLATVP